MARRVVVTDPRTVRAVFAAYSLDSDLAAAELGSVRLHQHQREAVARVHRSMETFGGALLADAVGLGKTFVALAVARSFTSTIVIAPAVLRDTWLEAAMRADVPVHFRSMESLALGTPPATSGFVIVDEAHHFRSRATRRYAALAHLIARTPVLLLTATPVHNKADDLANLLALFAGSAAGNLSSADLAHCVVRRHHTEVALRLPRLGRQRRVEIPADREILDRLLSLPPPVPVRDAGSCPTLISLSLAHAWCSSDAALIAALRRRLAVGSAIRDTLALGRLPSRSELRAWATNDAAVQLVFPELVVAESAVDATALLPLLGEHLAAVHEVLVMIRRAQSRDGIRSEALRTIRRGHRGAKLVAFSSYVETVGALYRCLAPDGEVALVSSAGGRIASSRLSRAEVLRQFRAPQHARENITLLLATDLLSEGVNLPEASVVVHLDLPWTAARLEQRVGRARRPGGSADRVWTYAFTQPREVERVLRREMLIRRKSLLGARLIGELALEPISAQRQSSAPRAAELTRALLRGWRDPTVTPRASRTIHVASTRSATDGFIALLIDDPHSTLLCNDSVEHATSDPAIICERLRQAGGNSVATDVPHFRAARRSIARWCADRAMADLLHRPGSSSPKIRLVLLSLIHI